MLCSTTFSISPPTNSPSGFTPRNRKQEAKLAQEKTGQAARRFRDFRYRTRKSWSCERRVVGKAEYLAKGSNPRFVVTNLSRRRVAAKRLYEKSAHGVRWKTASKNSSWGCSPIERLPVNRFDFAIAKRRTGKFPTVIGNTQQIPWRIDIHHNLAN